MRIFRAKKKPDKAEEKYKAIINLELREKKFQKEYFDEAARLEKKRDPKEYVR
jgi:hypothetical protein